MFLKPHLCTSENCGSEKQAGHRPIPKDWFLFCACFHSLVPCAVWRAQKTKKSCKTTSAHLRMDFCSRRYTFKSWAYLRTDSVLRDVPIRRTGNRTCWPYAILVGDSCVENRKRSAHWLDGFVAIAVVAVDFVVDCDSDPGWHCYVEYYKLNKIRLKQNNQTSRLTSHVLRMHHVVKGRPLVYMHILKLLHLQLLHFKRRLVGSIVQHIDRSKGWLKDNWTNNSQELPPTSIGVACRNNMSILHNWRGQKWHSVERDAGMNGKVLCNAAVFHCLLICMG